MTDNPKSYEVILLDHSETGQDETGSYLRVYNVDGSSYKIGAKRQKYWNVKLLPQYTPVVLVFETFVNEKQESISYVVDAHKLETYDLDLAAVRGTLKRLLSSQNDDRNRSTALSYAKDILVATFGNKNAVKQSDIDNTLDIAKQFFYFIKGQQPIETNSNDTEGKPTDG